MSFASWFQSLRSRSFRARAAQESRRARRRAARPLSFESLEDRCLLAGLIADGPLPPTNLTDVSGTLFFSVNNVLTGGRLYASDGTAEGTVLLRTFTPIFSPFVSVPSLPGPANLTNFNGTLFFTANDGVTGTELWRSDGTPEGTVLVKDINPGSSVVSPPSPPPGGPIKTTTTGAPSNTTPIIILPTVPNSSAPSNLTVVNDTLFFSAFNRLTGRELWKSDGTEAGTVLVKDISPGFDEVIPIHGTDGFIVEPIEPNGPPIIIDPPFIVPRSSAPSNLVNVNGTLFFSASTTLNGRELWTSDGTATGTVLVRDIQPGILGSSPVNLTEVNGTLFFSAFTLGLGTELYKSDGTEAGTVLVRDINPGNGNAFSSPGGHFLVNVDGTLFFSAFTPETGRELWRSDGSEEGTVLVQDINPGSTGALPGSSFRPAVLNGVLYFAADDGSSGLELWRSDGTPEGTFLVQDINPGAGSSSPLFLTVVGDTLFFAAFDPDRGQELWRSDGTADCTALVRDIVPGPDSSFPSSLVAVGGTLFFGASTPFGGGLWRSDGTEDGTFLLVDFGFLSTGLGVA